MPIRSISHWKCTVRAFYVAVWHNADEEEPRKYRREAILLNLIKVICLCKQFIYFAMQEQHNIEVVLCKKEIEKNCDTRRRMFKSNNNNNNNNEAILMSASGTSG